MKKPSMEMSNQYSQSMNQPHQTMNKDANLTEEEINAIIHDKKLLGQKIKNLLASARQEIQKCQIEPAIAYLNSAETILESAANTGKSIERSSVMIVLHNLAFCYQNLWQLQECSNYLEALIYNINTELKSVGNSPTYSKFASTNFSKFTNVIQSLKKKSSLSKYYLQFSAINSQIKNHTGALISAKKSVQIIKNQLKQFQETFSHRKKERKQNKEQHQQKMRIISKINQMHEYFDINQIDLLTQTCRFYLKLWKSQKFEQKYPFMIKHERSYHNFSIGSVMQISPISYSEQDINAQDINSYFNINKLIESILNLSIGYFTIATQLRLIAGSKAEEYLMDRKDRVEFKQSQIYHLLAIIIVSIFIPFKVSYMQHMLTSFNGHYSIDLNRSDFPFKKNYGAVLFGKRESQNKNKQCSIELLQLKSSRNQKKDKKNKLSSTVDVQRSKIRVNAVKSQKCSKSKQKKSRSSQKPHHQDQQHKLKKSQSKKEIFGKLNKDLASKTRKLKENPKQRKSQYLNSKSKHLKKEQEEFKPKRTIVKQKQLWEVTDPLTIQKKGKNKVSLSSKRSSKSHQKQRFQTELISSPTIPTFASLGSDNQKTPKKPKLSSMKSKIPIKAAK